MSKHAPNPYEKQINDILSQCDEKKKKKIINSLKKDAKRTTGDMINIDMALPYSTMPDITIYKRAIIRK